jgi:hypothetical protein
LTAPPKKSWPGWWRKRRPGSSTATTDEVAEAQALLAMLARLARTKAHKQHLNDLLDEGLKATFPASDPIAVGGFTGAEVLPSP